MGSTGFHFAMLSTFVFEFSVIKRHVLLEFNRPFSFHSGT